MNLTRRQFHTTVLAGLSTAVLANPMGLPLACQTYPVRDALLKDPDATLRDIAAMGYKNIEMCSPKGYKWDVLDLGGAELRKKFAAAGLGCESCHFGLRELKENGEARIGWAKDLGLKQMIIASFGLPNSATLADWKTAASDANRIGETTRKAGIQLGFHNHDGEFKELDGKLIYDELLKSLDPALVKMQFQVSVVHLGFHAADYMTKYPGRFLSLHLQDWSDEQKKQVAIGSGVVDWKKLFAAAKKGGVKNYFVELPRDAMQPSADFLKTLKA